jgi:Tol biopolymer transport system component
MDAERWQRIDELVQVAVELPPAERAAFLDEACAGDEGLRARVLRLLSYDERAFTLVERPAAELAVDLFASAEPALSAGQRLGRYEVLDFVGAGGMGEVYRARDAELGRTVALKLLPSDFTSDDIRVRRFQAEARAASSLNHPNIITVYEIGHHEDAQFIATEFIEGDTLRERLRRGALTPREALEIAVQAAEALAAAHRASIVHRDVKPENIMLRPDGYVKVLDFGLAKLTEQEVFPADALTAGATATDSVVGTVVGTVRYMSPEQTRGDRLDASSDVFSLGVVIFEMIAGRLPFDGETSDAVIAAILHCEPVALSAYALSVPDELERIVACCLAKSAGERYRDATELLSDLEALVRALDRHVYVRSRRRATATGAAAVAGVLLFGASGYSAFRWLHPEPSEPFRTVTTTDVAAGATPATATISPDGKHVAELDTSPSGPDYALFVRDLATGTRACVVSSDVAPIAPVFSPDSASVYYYTAGRWPAGVSRLPAGGGEAQKVVDAVWSEIGVSPDGRRLAFLRPGEDGVAELVVAGADGSDAQAIATRRRPDGFFLDPDWSPDGRRLICRDVSGLVEVSVEDGAATPVAKGPLEMIRRVRWRPDGRGLVVLGAAAGQDLNQLWYLTYPDGQARTITDDGMQYVAFSETADGSTLLGLRQGAFSSLMVAQGGDLYQVAQITNEPLNTFWIVVWTPDGRILAANTADGTRDLWVMDADGTNRRRLTNGMNAEFPSASPDGRYIAFTSRHWHLNEIWRIDADGSNPTRLAEGRAPTCSPDGSVIYVHGRSLWKVPIQGGTPVELAKGPYEWPEVSPDGTLVVCYYRDDPAKPPRVAVLSANDGRLVKMLDTEPHGPVHWTTDGRGVITWNGGVVVQPVEGGPAQREIEFPGNWNLMPMVAGYATRRDGTLVWVNSTPYAGTILIKNVE